MRGILLTFEGIDAAGKSVLSQAVASRLKAAGASAVLVSRKQTEGYPDAYLQRFMQGLGSALWGAKPDDPVSLVPEVSWLQLHALWYRTMHTHLLAGLQSRYDYVVLDGWYYKCLARHRVHAVEDAVFTEKTFLGIPDADVAVMVDVPPDVCWRRRSGFRASELGAHGGGAEGSAEERFIAYQAQVRKRYLEMASDPKRWWVIRPESQGVDEVASGVVARLL